MLGQKNLSEVVQSKNISSGMNQLGVENFVHFHIALQGAVSGKQEVIKVITKEMSIVCLRGFFPPVAFLLFGTLWGNPGETLCDGRWAPDKWVTK